MALDDDVLVDEHLFGAACVLAERLFPECLWVAKTNHLSLQVLVSVCIATSTTEQPKNDLPNFIPC